MIRVLIADDDSRIREALRRIITQAPDMTVVGEAVNGRDALNKISTVEADVILLDITMPDLNGLEVLKLAKRDRSELRILMVSVHSPETYAERALKAGASGYMTKDRAAEHLVPAIRKVVSGTTYLSAPLTSVVMPQPESCPDTPPLLPPNDHDSDS
jgi:two-component system, NarL family, invasion response regulator UvrY